MSQPYGSGFAPDFDLASAEVSGAIAQKTRGGPSFTIGSDLAALLGNGGGTAPLEAESKTVNMPEERITTGNGDLAATANDMPVTVTKMTDPQSQPPVLFHYGWSRVTSHGRTTQNWQYGGNGMAQALLHFSNRAGGLLFLRHPGIDSYIFNTTGRPITTLKMSDRRHYRTGVLV